ILLKHGPYGFYIQLGEDRRGYSPKRASVSQIKDVGAISLEVALDLLQYPKLLGNHPDDGGPVHIKIASKGFSIRHRRTISPVPKNLNPKDITLEKALKLLLSKDAKQCGRPKGKAKVKEAFEAF
ncbi:Dna topoisomerase, partial [Thalictrum thalictroides]